LSAEVAAQSALLQQLLADLQQLLPSDLISDASVDAGAGAGAGLGAGATCRRQINELSARLQQQQLSLTEAQRRAEKAEKLAAAMDQAQAKASTEIERLSAELEMANARQAESLQHAVELERRLATAEARLARVGDHGLSAETRVSTEALSASASASLGPGDLGGSATRAPVLYEVRADDTLSRISARVYGDAGAWERIYEANRDLLVAPDALSPGMSLVIP
jgi:nucleoid-associated protein YgaU